MNTVRVRSRRSMFENSPSFHNRELIEFRRETTARFDKVDQRLATADQRFNKIDQRFEAIDRRFEAVDQRFDSIDGRLGRMEDVQVQILQTLTTHLVGRGEPGGNGRGEQAGPNG